MVTGIIFNSDYFGMIAPESIEEVKARSSILEVIGEHLELKRQGGRYVGLCPFHGERTPSFFVREEERTYRCFGCGASGNIFSFVMETRGVSFPEAVEDLAGRYGVKLKYAGKQEGVSHSRENETLLYRINTLAWEFFKGHLANAPQVVTDYIQKRSLNEAQINAYGMGYAPVGWRELTDHLRKYKVSEDLLIKSGLVRRNQRGDMFDLFRGRVLFPIFIDKNRIVGFGGRSVPGLMPDDDKSPKYINSPETEVYSKQRILFGLPQAMATIRSSGEVYLVEGYMDVVGLWGGNVKNVVATCGTAVTEHHVRRLGQVARRVIVLFDGDRAGRDAAAKCFELFLNSGIDTIAYFMPDGVDPDELAIKYGPACEEELRKLQRAPLFDCYLEKFRAELAASGPTGIGVIAEKVGAVIKRVENTVEKALLVNRAAGFLMLEVGLIRKMVEDAAAPKKIEPLALSQKVEISVVEANSEVLEFNKLGRFEGDLLLAVMVRREFASTVLHDAVVCEQLSPVALRFLSELDTVISADGEEAAKRSAVRELLGRFGESWLHAWRRAHLMAEDKRVDIRRMFEETVFSFKKKQLNQVLSELDRAILTESDNEMKFQLIQEKVDLNRRIKELRPA